MDEQKKDEDLPKESDNDLRILIEFKRKTRRKKEGERERERDLVIRTIQSTLHKSLHILKYDILPFVWLEHSIELEFTKRSSRRTIFVEKM